MLVCRRVSDKSLMEHFVEPTKSTLSVTLTRHPVPLRSMTWFLLPLMATTQGERNTLVLNLRYMKLICSLQVLTVAKVYADVLARHIVPL